MQAFKFAPFLCLLIVPSYCQTAIISTIAGNGTYGYAGDGGPALNAEFFNPNGLAVDATGNIYIADQDNFRVRMIAPNGIISTVAGDGGQGYTGDGGPATSAALSYLTAIALDGNGNLYIADENYVVRRVNLSTGIITTFAGNGTFAHSGDGGPATAASLYYPTGLAVDSSNNVYISEYYGEDVRVVNANTGIITTFAGTGVYGSSGDGGPASSAQLTAPRGLVVSNGNLYIVNGCVIRSVNLSTNIISSFAGSESNPNACTDTGDGSPATQATLENTWGVGADALGGIYIVGYNDERIRYVNPSGIISTVVGTGSAGFSGDGGPPAQAQIEYPLAATVDASNRLLIADAGNERIRRVVWLTPTSSTLASSANPSASGQTVSFTAAVTPTAANGTIQFLDGATNIGSSSVVNGYASISTSTLAVGAHSITAVYVRDSTYDTSTSAPLTQTVLVHTTANISSSNSPSSAGAIVTFGSNVFPSSATGTVQFFDNGNLLGSAQLANGLATFSTSALSVGSHTIYSTYLGDANDAGCSSPSLTQVVQSSSSTAVTASPNPSVVGSSVTLVATVSPASATGTVQFLDGGNALGSATLSSGAASFSTASLATGSHSITAIYSGDANDAGSTSAVYGLTVNPKTTTTAITASPNPSVVGSAVAFTATVSPASATGTVQFLDGGTVLGTATLSGGTASFSTSGLGTGSHSITAIYSGDANDAGSTSVVYAQTVNPKTTTTAITASPNPSVMGSAVAFTATVSPASATGTVQFLDGATTLGTATLVSGTASFSTSGLATGSHSIMATYSGDPNDAGSTSAVYAQTVNPKTTTTAITASPNPSVVGSTVAFTATVSPTSATGTVQFLDGGTALGTATLSGGTASFSTSGLATGSHSITAIYSGDANDATSTSAVYAQTVNPKTTTTAVTASPNPSVVGSAVAFTATVSPASATGTVQFLDGGAVLGTATLSSGTALFSTSGLATGSHSITAVYSGDANDASSTSAVYAQTVNAKTATSTTVTATPNPSTAGATVTFKATVTPASATGTVQFLDGSTVIGTGTLASGSASYATSGLASGIHSITASYSGNAADQASTSAALTQTVSPGAPSNLTATAAGSSQINLAWSASATTGVTYNVYQSTSAGFTPSASNRVATGVTSTNYSASGLTAGATYYYRVTAVSAGAESVATNQASATTGSAVACHVVYTVDNQWNVGFTDAVTIQNTGSAPINNWTLSWTWPGNQEVTESWNATYTQTGANVKLTYMSYNSSIAAGATLNGVGFNGSYSGSNPPPTAFYVNGILCH